MTDLILDFDISGLDADPICRRRRPVAPAFGSAEDRDRSAAFALLSADDRTTVLEAARLNWEARAAAEYIGVMVARKLHGLLVDLGAPLDLQTLALSMLLDEQRHAELCLAAAQSLGSDGSLVVDLEELQQARSAAPLTHQLVEMVVGTYAVGEVCALALVKHTLKALPDTPYRTVLKRVAADEVLHARFGPLLLAEIRAGRTAQWLPNPGDAALLGLAEDTRAAMLRRDVVEAEEVALAADPRAAEALAWLGVPHPLAFRAAYVAALGVDVPAALARAGLTLSPSPRSRGSAEEPP